MSLEIGKKHNSCSTKVKSSGNVILMERDLEILQFICEMKFARTEDIFRKFFRVLKSGEVAVSDLWARKRLFQLVKGGFLRATKLPLEKSTFYTVTVAGFRALKNIFPENANCYPADKIDYRTYSHDLHVLDCRLLLEEKSQIKKWISDRTLKQYPEFSARFRHTDVPDGIFIDNDGKATAFEFEISRKSKDRYREKVRTYIYYIRNKNLKLNFEQVIFVCTDFKVYEFLKNEVNIYGDLVRIFMYSEFKETFRVNLR